MRRRRHRVGAGELRRVRRGTNTDAHVRRDVPVARLEYLGRLQRYARLRAEHERHRHRELRQLRRRFPTARSRLFRRLFVGQLGSMGLLPRRHWLRARYQSE